MINDLTYKFRTGICLNMIVKNEAKIIDLCLNSVAPFISCYVIADTGSTDGTQEIIKRFFDDKGIPGQIHEFDFVNFSWSRNKALELARESSLPFEYLLFCDADMELRALDPHWFKLLTAPVYSIQQKTPAIEYWNVRLIRRDVSSRYIGVTHEYLDTAYDQTRLQTIFYIDHACGSNRSDKFRRDAKLLESALESEPGNARYWFYLAQSWRDAKEYEKALDCYRKRAALKGWQEEVFYSLYQIGRLKEQQGYPDDDVLAAYNAATAVNPKRAEAIHAASRFCRLKKLYDSGYEISKPARDMREPEGALFSEPAVYTKGLLDEFSINAYWAGHYDESLEACLKLLGSGKLNAADLARIAANAEFSRKKMVESSQGKGFLSPQNQHSVYSNDHKLDAPPTPRAVLVPEPRVLIAILAKQKEPSLPLYLECIEKLDYPKSSIVLYIRTNNNQDRTEAILRDWVDRVGDQYAGVEFDAKDVEQPVQDFGVHEWNVTRFKVLGHIRNVSLQKTFEYNCDFYFVSDVDNFLRACTLRELVGSNLPIVAPLLRCVVPTDPYSNYHAAIDPNGYFLRCDQYYWILNRLVRGLVEVPVVHATYLIRKDVIEYLNYDDGTGRYEYVIFSDSARKASIPQFLDNRCIYGYLAFDEGDSKHVPGVFDLAYRLMFDELNLSTSPLVRQL